MIWRPYPIRQADSLPASVPVLHQHQAPLHQGLYAAAKSGIYFKRAERSNFAFYHPPMDRVPLNKIDLSLIKFLPLSNCPLQLCHDIYTHTHYRFIIVLFSVARRRWCDLLTRSTIVAISSPLNLPLPVVVAVSSFSSDRFFLESSLEESHPARAECICINRLQSVE